MAVETVQQHNLEHPEIVTPEGFLHFDESHRSYDYRAEEMVALHGLHKLVDRTVLETPQHILDQGKVLTNPSQLVRVRGTFNGRDQRRYAALFREENLAFHLGTTTSPLFYVLPRYVLPRRNRTWYLEQDPEIRFIGEDPRIIPHLRLRSHLGLPHEGVGVSTVVAIPDKSDPTRVAHFQQEIRWGKTLRQTELVMVLKKQKNATLCPVLADEYDVRVDVIGRPHPHMSFGRFKQLERMSEQSVLDAQILTEKMITHPTTHVGGNNAVRIDPNHIALDMHQAYRETTPRGLDLYYRLIQAIIETSEHEEPEANLVPLQVTAVRGDFPETEPKVSDKYVHSYGGVAFGSVGQLPYAVIGLSDRHPALARRIRVA